MTFGYVQKFYKTLSNSKFDWLGKWPYFLFSMAPAIDGLWLLKTPLHLSCTSIR